METGQELHIAVVGDAASDTPITGGHGRGAVVPYYTISPLKGIQNAVQNVTGKYNIAYYPSTDINEEEIEFIIQSDIIIYATGTESGEGSDRENLSLPDQDENLILRLAEESGNKMIVCIVSPGAILMPWSDKVQAIVLQFFPGQEAGNALADVLFGYISPSGKLPLTMPNKENEVEFSQEAYPGVPADDPKNSTYEEELLVGYRWYHYHNVIPKFAFGFGLSYATFELSDLSVTNGNQCSSLDQNCEIRVYITRTDNLGDKYQLASEVVQLYLDVSLLLSTFNLRF